MKKYIFTKAVLILILFTTACGASEPTPTPTTIPVATAVPAPTTMPTATPEWQREGWQIVWQDEFEGTEINADFWTHEVGGHGFGNNEAQYYSNDPKNSYIEEGHLVIEALEENVRGKLYTSARLITQNKVEVEYGRIEARIKIPAGQGIWPAFWMLGDDILSAGWPQSGEIDIMENIGKEPQIIHGTVHGPGYAGADGIGGSNYLADEPFSAGFHEFAVEWEPEEIRWYLDDIEYFVLTSDEVPGEWVYDHPFFMILNVAIGGNWPGYPDDTTLFPQQMRVDYVRVYERVAE